MEEYVTTLTVHFPETCTMKILVPRIGKEQYWTLPTIFQHNVIDNIGADIKSLHTIALTFNNMLKLQRPALRSATAAKSIQSLPWFKGRCRSSTCLNVRPDIWGLSQIHAKCDFLYKLLLQATDQLYITSGEDRRRSNYLQDIIVSPLINHCSEPLIDCFSCVNTGN